MAEHATGHQTRLRLTRVQVFVSDVVFEQFIPSFNIFPSALSCYSTMSVLKNIFVFFRVQRRRHRSLFLAIGTISIFMALLFLWHEPSYNALSSVTVQEECGFLPAFLCRLHSPEEAGAKPFDPLAEQLLPLKENEKPQKFPLDGAAQASDPKHKTTLPEGLPSGLTQEKYDLIYSDLTGEALTRLKEGHKFYNIILRDLVAARPSFSSKLDRYADGVDGKFAAERFDDVYEHPMHLEEYLRKFLQVNETEIKALKLSHELFLRGLPEHAPKGLYQKDGIVFVGGGKFNWLALLSIRVLRNKGCVLPIEVLIPTPEEYEINICSNIFPGLNAKCIHLPTNLYGDRDGFASHLSFKGYQYKSLAILLSSFENVLLMDSDNIAAYAPDHLFTSEPFISSGLVVWPDYWRRSTSPSFYEVAGVSISTTEITERYVEKWGSYKSMPVPKNSNFFSEVPYHERVGAIPEPSSESGQLMISKKTHLKALLLALYYNTYGPKYYYPMFSQGAHGEGDKETFLAASVVLKKKFYQVGKFLTAIGNVKKDSFKGHGMGQYDPVLDYNIRLKKKDAENKFSGDELEKEIMEIGEPKMLFLHANFPKLDPWALKELGETIDEDGRHRLYGWSLRWRTGTDLESDIWDIMNNLLCVDNLNIEHFKNVNRTELCEEVSQQMIYLKQSASKLE